jgi:hypothetical protein
MAAAGCSIFFSLFSDCDNWFGQQPLRGKPPAIGDFERGSVKFIIDGTCVNDVGGEYQFFMMIGPGGKIF